MSSPVPLVHLDRVSLRFGAGEWILRDTSLSLTEGECVAIVGPSGCGKSTLLRLVAGLLAPTTGDVRLTGEVETAFVFQDATLLPWLNIVDNVAVPCALRGLAPALRRERARQALARVGLGERGDFFPRQLSGGQKMRASLARALSVGPRLLLLDEPFGALDELTRESLNDLILRLRREEGWTVLLVTHSVPEAVHVADRVVVLGPGLVHRTFDLWTGPDERGRHGPRFHEQCDAVSAALREVTPALV